MVSFRTFHMYYECLRMSYRYKHVTVYQCVVRNIGRKADSRQNENQNDALSRSLEVCSLQLFEERAVKSIHHLSKLTFVTFTSFLLAPENIK